MSSYVLECKTKGNDAFKIEKYSDASNAYSEALAKHSLRDELRATLLCNRAACSLKTMDYKFAVKDCSDALTIVPAMTKALFRRASAYDGLHKYANSLKDLNTLLHFDPKNTQGIAMMRKVKAIVLNEQSNSSEVKNIIDTSQKDESRLSAGLHALIGLCYEDRNHAMDLLRKGGISWLCDVINKELTRWLESRSSIGDGSGRELSTSDTLVVAIRVLSAASNHKDFILSGVNIASREGLFDEKRFTGASLSYQHNSATSGGQPPAQLSFVSVCSLLTVLGGTCALPAVLMLLMNTLKAFPATLPVNKSPQHSAASSGNSGEVVYTLSPYTGAALLTALCAALDTSHSECFTAVTDTISAFISDSADYFDTPVKEVDMRMESMEARKQRQHEAGIIKTRSVTHCKWAIECGILHQLIANIDRDNTVIRQNSANCLGKLVNYVENVDQLKPLLLPFLPGAPQQEEPSESKRVVELLDDEETEVLSVPVCRRRAAVEAALLVSHPDLGAWALELPGGVAQLLQLVATGDLRCQEVAAEVICLASALESASNLLAVVVSSGTLTTLLHAPSPGIRAAAASTMTKLSIKAKALNQDSAEVAQIMNTALTVLKSANSPASASLSSNSSVAAGKGESLVSFSTLDEVGAARAQQKKSAEANQPSRRTDTQGTAESAGSGGITMTAVERAIEALAALVGKSYIKEEIVHGSYRVAACVAELTKLDLDVRSTAAYGAMHILCALTVTNRELRAIALADKDITPEQYEQMQELQRIKTKDEAGNVIEEKKEETDIDTADLCCRRIKRIVACDGIKFLTKYLAAGSGQTKEAAARALRQIAVEHSARGLIIQQGALKACCTAAVEEENKKSTRLECAHAVAKTLVTTNPNLLSEHQRLGSVKPLLLLCHDSASTELQHFEALLALTNVLSCGEAEQEKFAAEKGVHAVHYLIFSDNWMVRRAATETLCNMAASEHVLQLLRVSEKLKLWLGLCEEGVGIDEDEAERASATVEVRKAVAEEVHERYLTARAAAGTLAVAAGADAEVCSALVSLDCARTLTALLESAKPELVHRALVWITEMVATYELAGDTNEEERQLQEKDRDLRRRCAMHLMEGGVVTAISVVLRLKDAQLGGLAREAAQALSKVIGNSGMDEK